MEKKTYENVGLSSMSAAARTTAPPWWDVCLASLRVVGGQPLKFNPKCITLKTPARNNNVNYIALLQGWRTLD